MKKLLKYLMILLLLCSAVNRINAQEDEDMSKWSFKILLQHADQMDDLKVVRFFNRDSGRFGFCLEAGTDYDPKNSVYIKQEISDETIYDIVKAFEFLGDDYYIAAQLMIWEYRSGIRYSFDGKDASDYGEADLIELISSFHTDNASINEFQIIAERGQDQVFTFDHLDEYIVEKSDVEILRKENNEIVFRISNDLSDTYQILLKPGFVQTDGSYLYHSEMSQDLYSFEGEYTDQKKILITIIAEDRKFTLKYSKTDTETRPISGAEFKLYELDEMGDSCLNIVRNGSEFDMKTLSRDRSYSPDSEIEVSERYKQYLNGWIISPEEQGYFDFRIKGTDEEMEGRIYVCNDMLNGSENYRQFTVKEIGTYVSADQTVNCIYGLDPGKKYILCESHPKNGYVYASDPCQLIDPKEDDDIVYEFRNGQRRYDLRLFKENDDHSILLNGAKFRLTYKENEKEKEKTFVTGALCIQQKDNKSYVLYRHEKDENIYVGEFKEGYFIKKDAIPGRYLYLITDELNINDRSLLKQEITVINGGFEITDMPYASLIDVKELEAPRGYYIDEEAYHIVPELDYSEIIFRNFRVNSFVILPEQKRKIPKTCIGD